MCMHEFGDELDIGLHNVTSWDVALVGYVPVMWECLSWELLVNVRVGVKVKYAP